MALRFYVGGSGAGKTHQMLSDMIARAAAEPERRFLVIVPEQYTMQTQRTLVSLHPGKCILNLEVLSLARLAHRVFAEVGFHGETLLEEIGKSFLLEKTVLENRKELKFFGNNLARPENIAELKAMISELMLYDVSPEQLLSAESGGLLGAKIRDAAMIYGAFRKRLEGTYMTMEEIPDRLSALAHESELIRGSVFAFDGFTGFTPVQLRLLETLMKLASDVLVAVTADPEEDLFRPLNGTELFGMSAEMARAFSGMAGRTGTEILPAVTIERSVCCRQAGSEALTHLEKMLFRRTRRPFAGSSGDLRVIAAKNPREEVECAALQISRLVREEGLRFRDIAIVTGDLGTYGDCAREIMAQYNIPCFVDEKRRIMMNPFIEYLRAAIEACAEDYSYESMFRLLRCGMLDFDCGRIDRLELYCVGRGIRGKKRWRAEFIHPYPGEDPGEVPMLNELRKSICELLDPLADAFSRRGSTVREKSEALYDLCVRSHAGRTLKEREARCRENDRPELALEYAQVWPYVMGFLDKLVSVLGEEKISMRDYAALLDAGFGEARLAIIPTGNDRIFIGDVVRSRIPEVKVLIFLGMNEGIVPKPPKSGGILTDLDRSRLAEKEIKLKPTAREAMYIERFYLYLALTKPSQKLLIFFSQSKESGEAAHPAYVIDLLRKLFPNMSIEVPGESLLERIEREDVAFTLLADGMRELGQREPEPGYLELFSHYINHPDYSERAGRLLAAAAARRTTDEIGNAAAKAIYGTRLAISASRLERFCECEFKHFLQYGLKLRERPTYEFGNLNFGTVMHRSLELCAGRLAKQGLDERCDENTLHACADEAFDTALAEEGMDSALFTSARALGQTNRMRRILHHSLSVLSGQNSAGEFRLFGSEEAFRGGQELKALSFRLSDGTPMILNGRIDRIDVAESGDAAYVRVIDFKTGHAAFDLTRIYHGLQLQLALYMNASMEMLRTAGRYPVMAGMLYFPVRDPIVNYVDGEDDASLFSRRTKEMKISGAVSADPEILKLLDRNLAAEGRSDYYPVNLKKDGTPDSRSKVFREEEFRLIGDYAAKKALETGERIMSGAADINPYRSGEETACLYCPHRTVCGFDERLPGFEYRELPTLKPAEALEHMQQMLDDNGGEEEESNAVD